MDAAVCSRYADGAVHLALMEHTLHDGDAIFAVLDLYFCRTEGAGWVEYFAALDPLYDAVVRHLEMAPTVSSAQHEEASDTRGG